MRCSSRAIVRNGHIRSRQSFKCCLCGYRFLRKRDLSFIRQRLWRDYIWHRQTLAQLAREHHRSIPWIQKQLDQATIAVVPHAPQPVIALADTTFFRRGYGVLVIRCPRIKKNLHFHDVRSETPEEYRRAREELESRGYVIEGAVIDGRRGVQAVFADVPVQLCQFHQIAIVRRYLTSRPKLDAGKELRAITLTLPISAESVFSALLGIWFEKWRYLLKERTYSSDYRHWQYTHRRLRSAHRSLMTNLPYLFTYRQHPHLKMPNTTNSLDGYFSKLKQLLNTHRGLTIERRYRLIQEILANPSQQKFN